MCVVYLTAGDFGEHFFGAYEVGDGDVVFFAARDGLPVFGGAQVRYVYVEGSG